MKIRILLILAFVLLIPTQASANDAVPYTTGEFAKATDYLRSINLPIPDVSIRLGYGSSYMATAEVGQVTLYGDYVTQFERSSKESVKNFCPSDITINKVILHELLHQMVGSPTWAYKNEEFLTAYMLEEGIVEAVSIDLFPSYFKWRFGASVSKIFLPNSVEYLSRDSAYKDQLVYVRKLSAQATGKKWTSKEAFNWRVWMLHQDFPTRIEVVNSLNMAV
jgi:hypothetical protein